MNFWWKKSPITQDHIEQDQFTRLLGVTFTSELSWGRARQLRPRQASQQFFFIRRTFKIAGINPDSLVKIYPFRIGSLTEYALPCRCDNRALYNNNQTRWRAFRKELCGSHTKRSLTWRLCVSAICLQCTSAVIYTHF